MYHHSIYDTATGEIVGGFSCIDAVLPMMTANIPEGQDVFLYTEQDSSDKFWIDGNTYRQRLESACSINATELTIPSGGKATVTIAGLPIPCFIDIEGILRKEVTDGEFSASTAIPGTYKITMKSVPCFDKSWEVVIT